MKKIGLYIAASMLIGFTSLTLQASPESEMKAFQNYFQQGFPDTEFQDFSNGIYGIDKVRRVEWESIEDFPPYEMGVDIGEELFNTPFKNGKTYASCFPNGGIGIRQNYPYFDAKSGTVKTLEGDINACRTNNGEKALKWKKGKLAAISAYMSYTSRGNKLDIKVPNDPRAHAMLKKGKDHFFAKRGQLNMSCADCHFHNAGKMARANLLSPALGNLSHFPVYRKKWESKGKGVLGGFGTVHRRFGGCNKQVRAKPYKAQSDDYKALEYYLTYMSNGIEVNGPGMRQ